MTESAQAMKADMRTKLLRRKRVLAWFVLNKTASEDMAAGVMDLLGKLRDRVVGSLPYNPSLAEAALSGRPIDEHGAAEHVEPIMPRLE
jgi:CO dehydrogenase nickel-insertion accessory protein CooC1